MPYRLLRAVFVTALVGLLCLLPACRSDLSTQSTLYVVVHEKELDGLIPVLKENGVSLEPLDHDGWEIRNDARSRKAFRGLLTTMDQTIEIRREKLASAYSQACIPGRQSRYANQCLRELRQAHDQRDRVALILEQMDPSSVCEGSPSLGAVRRPDGSWRPTAAFYDARLPLDRVCSNDELIEDAAHSRTDQRRGERLTATVSGPPVARR